MLPHLETLQASRSDTTIPSFLSEVYGLPQAKFLMSQMSPFLHRAVSERLLA
jgi:hypothetical protein